jgi:hypothetical protein
MKSGGRDLPYLIFSLLLALLSMGLAAPAWAGDREPRLARTPWETRFPGDIQWQLAVDQADGEQWNKRWVLAGMTPATSPEGLVEMHFAVDPSPDARAFMEALFAASAELCTHARFNFGKPEPVAGYTRATGNLMCAQVKEGNFGAITHYVVLVKGTDVFVVSRQSRHPPTEVAGQLRFDSEEAATDFGAGQVASGLYLKDEVYLCGEGINDERCQPALASTEQSAYTVSPVFSQSLRYGVPEGWVSAFRQVRGNLYVLEYIPEGEAIESWSQMLTLQGVKMASWSATPDTILDSMRETLQRICPKTVIHERLGTIDIQGFEAIEALHGCGKFTDDQPSGARRGQGEVAYVLAIQGRNDIYLIQKAMRVDAFKPKKSPLTAANVQDFVADVLPVSLCKLRGESSECEPDSRVMGSGN